MFLYKRNVPRGMKHDNNMYVQLNYDCNQDYHSVTWILDIYNIIDKENCK